MTLLEDALRACGGMDRWQRLKRFTVHMSIDGPLLARRGKGGLLKEIVVEGCTRTQSLRMTGFGAPDHRGVYQPERVAIERLDGQTLQERHNPRAAFLGQGDLTPWDDLHLAYFCGCSVWHCLTTPFLLARSDIVTEELSSWHERGETWRRLRAVFPPRVAAHSPEQVFYFDAAGLQRRVDHGAIDSAQTQVAQYCSAHQAFAGIVVPTLRRSLRLQPGDAGILGPVRVDIEIFDASFA
jgi:hypothetical protein